MKSAPLLSKTCVICLCLRITAPWRGIIPLDVRALILAPLWIKISTMTRYPLFEAKWSAVTLLSLSNVA